MAVNLPERSVMSDLEIRADLIQVLESGIIKTEHVFHAADGVLGILNLKTGKSEGLFTTPGGQEHIFKKISAWKSIYEWKDGSSLVASAKPPKALSRAFVIDFEGTGFGLFPGGSKLRSWKVKNTSNQEICEIQPRGAFKRGALIKIRADIPVGLLVFSYCLVSKRWQEQSS